MDATTTVALGGIVVSGFVGPSVAALWTAHQQRARFQHERQSDALTELRNTLDDAAEELFDLQQLYVRVWSVLQGPVNEEQRPQAQFDFANGSKAALGTYQRLVLRLGVQHPAPIAYLAACDALDAGSRQSVNESGELDEERIKRGLSDCAVHAGVFYESSRALIGV